MAFAVKAAIRDPGVNTLTLRAQKTMYGGKHVAKGDTVFVFASETDGGHGLIARGVVTSAKAIAKGVGVTRQVPRVSISVRRTGRAKRPLGRSELKHFSDWDDGGTGSRLNFSSSARRRTRSSAYRDKAAAFLDGFSKLNSMR